MRSYLISLMAAGLVLPIAAQAQDGGFTRETRNHAERSTEPDHNTEDRSFTLPSAQRGDRSNRDRPTRVEGAPRSDRGFGVERMRRVERNDNEDGGVRRVGHTRRAEREVQRPEQVRATETLQNRRERQRRGGNLTGEFPEAGRDMADGSTGDRDDSRNLRPDPGGIRHWQRDRDGRRDWSSDWRSDPRYDWWSYRNRYDTLFRLGRYNDPYGRGYRRFTIGFSLWPSYYGSSFWLSDTWRYRLPPAYGAYRWIRYYDDALLVDVHTGQIVDVVHNVFW
jgi:hypothetical protein